MNMPLRKLTKANLKDFTLQDLSDLHFYLQEDLKEVQININDDTCLYAHERKVKRIKAKINLVSNLVAGKLVDRYL